MSSRLFLALALSLALHGALIVPDFLKRWSAAPARPALQASLRALVERAPEPELLLKNTIDSEAAPRPAVTPAPPATAKSPASPRREVQTAQRKLSQHLFYPAEAVANGIEGEVRLIVKLAADGSVSEVKVAATSGHAILDNAAIRAAYAIGTMGAGEARELIVPVIFRLQ